MLSPPLRRNDCTPCSDKFAHSSPFHWQPLHRRRQRLLQSSNLVPLADSAVSRQPNPPAAYHGWAKPLGALQLINASQEQNSSEAKCRTHSDYFHKDT